MNKKNPLNYSGLALLYAFQVTTNFNALVWSSAFLENEAVSVERVIRYTKLEVEAAAHIPGTPPR